MSENRHLADALRLLQQRGVLLLQDVRFPNLVSIVAGEAVRGSWWGHAQGKVIYSVGEKLGEHPDITTAKLVSGKVTFVHRALWPHLVAIGRARAPWQMRELNSDSVALLTRVDTERRVLASGKSVKQLELRLLVAGQEVHTESGRHATELLSWDSFAERRGVHVTLLPPPAQSRTDLEAVVGALNAEFAASGTLAWQTRVGA
jgi:hypothetical protein